MNLNNLYALCLLLLAGCATPLPYCGKWAAYSVNTNEGPMLAIDMDNTHKLIEVLNGLNEGKCRLEKKGET